MRAAFSVWGERIAPVFDVAQQVYVVDANSGSSLCETREAVPGSLPASKVTRLAELSVDTLVCGAISSSLLEMVAAYGIEVMPFVAGDLRLVIDAWAKGELEGARFAMPGCCGNRRHRFRGAPAAGSNSEQGEAEAFKYCVCPACGYWESRRRGEPCAGFRCPKCGAALARDPKQQ
jgi:predicted Fe-Mo cluster-binding NifX family protein